MRKWILLALFLSPAVLLAGDPREPVTVPYDGASAVVVPVPPGVSSPEAVAVAERAQESLDDVASGEVTLAQATRDPSKTMDPGGHVLFWVISILLGSVFRPATDVLVEKSRLDNRLSGSVNMLVVLGVYLGAWALCHASFPELPQDPVAWLVAGVGASGFGGGTQSYVRSRRGGGT